MKSKTLLFALVVAVCGCATSQYPSKQPERSAWWVAGGISSGTLVGAVGVSAAFVAAENYVPPPAIAIGAVAGGVAGYFLGRCARDEGGAACRVGAIVANVLAASIVTAAAALTAYCLADSYNCVGSG